MTLICDLQFQSLRATVVTHTHVKDQGQRSVGSKDRVKTDGRAEAITLISMLTVTAVGKNSDSPYHNTSHPRGGGKYSLIFCSDTAYVNLRILNIAISACLYVAHDTGRNSEVTSSSCGVS